MKTFRVALCVMSFTSAAVLAAENDLYLTRGNETMSVSRVPYTTHVVLGTNVFRVYDTEVLCKNGVPARVTTEVNAELRVKTQTRIGFNGTTWEKRLAAMDGVSGDELGHLISPMFGGPFKKWNVVPLYTKGEEFSSPYGKFYKVNEVIQLDVPLYKRQGRLSLFSPPAVTLTIKIKYSPQNGCRPIGFNIENTVWDGHRTVYIDRMTFDNGPYQNFAVSPRSSTTANIENTTGM